MKFLLALIVVLSLAFQSCGPNDKDIVAPTIRLLPETSAFGAKEVCGNTQPSVFTLSSGDTLHLQIGVEDDWGNAEAKIDIHQNFDCHGHSFKTEDWAELDVIPLNSSRDTIDKYYVIPPQVTAGTYHLGIYAVDNSGNEADPLFMDIVVQNQRDTVTPDLEVTAPSANTLAVSKGQVIQMQGNVRDNRALSEGGNGKLQIGYIDRQSGNYFLVLEKLFENGEGEQVSFNESFTVPNTWVKGTYDLQIQAFDGVRNPSAKHQITLQLP